MSASERFATMPAMICALARGLLALRLEVDELLVQVLGNLACDLRIRGRGAVAVGGMAGGADLVRKVLRVFQIRRLGLRAERGQHGGDAHQCTYHPWPRGRIERRDFIRLFSQAQFLAAAGRAAELPAPGPPEIVFAGRSNVGKSSAINAIVGRKRLAFTSKTPGRTQTINFYSLGDAARLVDLPGYGYARVPRPQRAQWRELVAAISDSRPGVAGDGGRHGRAPPAHAARQAAPRVARVTGAGSPAREGGQAHPRSRRRSEKSRRCVLFSSVTKQGVEECRGLLESWLEHAAEIKSPR